MLRRLRVLAAFFMVPIVILATPQSASALGEWHTVEIGVPASGWTGDSVPSSIDTIDCAFSLQQTGTHSINVGTGFCIGLPDVTWGYTQPGESGSSYEISVTGLTTAGASCAGSMTSTLGPHPKNGTIRVAGTISPGEIGVSSSDCNVTEVCLDLGGLGANLCVTADIPAEVDEPATSGCPVGTPHAFYSVERAPHPSVPGAYEDTVYVNTTIAVSGVSTASWGFAARGYGGPGTQAQSLITSNKMPIMTQNVTDPGAPLYAVPAQIAGIEVYANHPADDWNRPPPDGNAMIQPVPGTHPIPPGRRTPYYGWSDSSHCRFYFGPQVLDDGNPATNGDVPFGNGTDPNPPGSGEDPGPSPVLDEPDVPPAPDEDTGFLGPMWALLDWLKRWLNQLWAWIQDLGNWLAGLVVPETGYFETKWDGVDAKWAATTPSKYVEEFSSFTPGSVSGCAGVPLQVTLPGGVGIDERLGAACSGTMATSASVVRAAITAMVVVGGAFACVRALGSGLGWNPGVGRSEA